MKIVLIQNYYNPYVIGGAEINMENLVKELSDRGVETILITSHPYKQIEIEEPKPNLKIYRFFPFNFYFNNPLKKKENKIIKLLWWVVNLWNPFVFFTVRKILKKEKPDIVNIHNFYTFSPSVFSAAKSLKILVLYTSEDFFPLCKNSSFINNDKICWNQCFFCKLWAKWNKLFLKNIKYLFLSNFSRELFKIYFKVNGEVLHNPVYLSKEKIEKNMNLKEIRQNNLKEITFLFLGRLSLHKGILTLLKAFEEVKDENIRLLIGGSGELMDVVKIRAKRDSRLNYLGFVSGERKKEVLLNSDILVFPSEWYEVSPLTIQEAYGYGLPVIGTDLGSIPEHIDVDKTGWIFPYKDVDALTRIIVKLSKNREKIIENSKKCFEKALKNTSGQYVEKVIELFSE
jgi:glycosyltransferase involved in cell wall biosynthesis